MQRAIADADIVYKAATAGQPYQNSGRSRVPFVRMIVDVYAGAGVHVYVLDTGIRTSHHEFTSNNGQPRAVSGYDAVYNGVNAEDCHGHGTHVAAIIGGNNTSA